jgi:hypothetical protein
MKHFCVVALLTLSSTVLAAESLPADVQSFLIPVRHVITFGANHGTLVMSQRLSGVASLYWRLSRNIARAPTSASQNYGANMLTIQRSLSDCGSMKITSRHGDLLPNPSWRSGRKQILRIFRVVEKGGCSAKTRRRV